MKAISIRQPWAWLIVNGIKPVENRTWGTKYRGKILIHSGAKMDPNFTEIDAEIERRFGVLIPHFDLHRGAIVGIATVADCIHSSKPDIEFPEEKMWFYDSPAYWWILKDARACEPIPLKGALSLFESGLEESDLKFI